MISKSTTVRLNKEQRQRLQHMADMLNTSRNAIVGMLIDNARLEPVTKTEAVSTLPTFNMKRLEDNEMFTQ